jgi:hypothetical protein
MTSPPDPLSEGEGEGSGELIKQFTSVSSRFKV